LFGETVEDAHGVIVASVPEIKSTTSVNASPETVFDFIDHWPNAMRYLKRMVRWEPVDPSDTGVGGIFHVGVQAGPTRLNGRLKVTEHERPAKIAFKSIDGPRVDGSWTIMPDGDRSRVVLESYYEPPGGIIGRVVASFIKQNAQNDLDSSLRELKRLIEAS
jgi:uncharacterized membrane protein